MDGDHAVSAEFEPIPPRHLTVTLNLAPGRRRHRRQRPRRDRLRRALRGRLRRRLGGDADGGRRRGQHARALGRLRSNPSPGECVVTMDAARAVEAVFAGAPEPEPEPPAPPQRRTLSVLTTGTGGATVPAPLRLGPGRPLHPNVTGGGPSVAAAEDGDRLAAPDETLGERSHHRRLPRPAHLHVPHRDDLQPRDPFGVQPPSCPRRGPRLDPRGEEGLGHRQRRQRELTQRSLRPARVEQPLDPAAHERAPARA